MTWTEGHNWTITLTLEAGEEVSFKYIRKHNNGSVDWEGDPNHKFTPTVSGTFTEGWH